MRIDLNCYAEATGETVNLARCQKVGFKGVQARKVWHGRFGFKSYDHYGNCGTPATPDDTKYLTIARSATIAIVPESPDGGETPAGQGTHSCTVSWSNTVDSDSGVVTPNSCSIPDPVSYSGCNDGVSQTQINDAIGLANVNGCGENILWPEDEGGYSGTSALGLMGQIVNGTDSEIPGVELKGVVDSYEFTNTHIHVSVHKLMLDAECGWHKYTLTVEATLSDEYTSQDVKDEVISLLEWWDLADDKIYPWRRDLYTTVNPLVSRDEHPSPISPDQGCLDEAAGDYTGDILGKPFTSGYPDAHTSGTDAVEYFYTKTYGSTCELYHLGATVKKVERFYWNGSAYVSAHEGVENTDWSQATNEYGVTTVTILEDDPNLLACSVTVGSCGGDHPDYLEVTFDHDWLWGGHFDHRHTNHQWSGIPLADTIYHGAWSGGSGTLDPADACQPRTATQWTSSLDAARFPHGAWAIMESGQGVLWMQKYAEIKLPWKSQNWFGPCGKDRDVKTGYTCTLVEGVCVQSGGTAAWPNAWPIEGDRGCSAAVDGAKIKVTLDSAALWLRVGDMVDFTDAVGAVTEANVEVTDIDGSGAGAGPGLWFKFSGSLPTGTRVKSHGAPAYWWYDTDGKGSYSVIRHTFDHRAYALANPPATEDPGTMAAIERDCLSFNRCYPAVMCFSPNYDAEDEDTIDSFTHGKTYGFGEIVVDERYGSRWQAFFRQVMVDLWYVAPEVCSEEPGCSGVGTYSEDEGGCTADDDTHTYYPHRPMVECLEVMPAKWNSEADALVPDLGLEEPTYTALAAVGPAEHVTTPDPTPEAQAPWVLWLNMQICICAAGRWAEDGTLTSAPGYKFTGYKNVLGAYMCGAEPG